MSCPIYTILFQPVVRKLEGHSLRPTAEFSRSKECVRYDCCAVLMIMRYRRMVLANQTLITATLYDALFVSILIIKYAFYTKSVSDAEK